MTVYSNTQKKNMNSNKQQTMKNNKQQTAVEWYHQQIVDRQNGNGDSRSLDEIFQQAKAIHREEIKSTFYEGAFRESCESGQRYKYVGEEDAEKFYNETYGGK